MRLILLVVVGTMSGLVGQTISEIGAAAAGGTAGGAAGKKVSEGITNVFEKVDKRTTAAAAAPAPSKPPASTKPVSPLIEANPGVVGTGSPAAVTPKVAAKVPVARAAVTESVPAPPPLPSETVKRVETPKPPPPPVALVAVAPPPPPPVTLEDLRSVTVGESRDEVLKLGAPAARITMFDDGHLLEIYRYMAGDATFGVLRVIDGAVSQIDLR
jgi:hypothetical protein